MHNKRSPDQIKEEVFELRALGFISIWGDDAVAQPG
jgi:hypothetical protein